MATGSVNKTPLGPIAVARKAGLRYVSDHKPGISRKAAGKRFNYFDPRGRRIRSPHTLLRIHGLVIPPAWTDVWICPIDNGHLQATGRDARGRKQYRYHDDWRSARDETKYDKMIAFAHALPRIRRRVKRDLALRGLPKNKVLAAVVRLLETTLIRVGNDEYAEANGSFGLTTLRNRHVRVGRRKLHFEFRGKSGVEHEVALEDPRLARVVSACQDLPGQELFEYLDDEDQPRDVGSSDVNDYLRETAGDEFTAKDFRTWAGTVLAARALCQAELCESQAGRKRTVAQAIEQVAGELGNTKAVCRKCYIHPDILDAYADGALHGAVKPSGRRLPVSTGLSQEEKCVLKLLEARLRARRRTSAGHAPAAS